MSKSMTAKLFSLAVEKGPNVTQTQLMASIGELSRLQDVSKQKRLLSSLLKRVDISKEVEHYFRLERSKVVIECEQPAGVLTVNHLDLLSGLEFEKFLGWFFNQRGAKSCVTKSSGDHGVDLIVETDGKRIAVQAKRYRASSGVGAAAIRDAHSGMTIYDCHAAQVIATTFFTEQAKEEANKLQVDLWDRSRLQDEIELLSIKVGDNGCRTLVKPEARIEKRELRYVDLEESAALEGGRVLKVDIEGGVVRLRTSKGEPFAVVKGADAKWIQMHNEKGATIKVKYLKSKKQGECIEAEAEWFEVK